MTTQPQQHNTHPTTTMQDTAWMACAVTAKQSSQSQHAAAKTQAAMQVCMQSDTGTHPLTDLNR